MANSLNLNSVYYYIFRNLSMIAYVIGFQKSKFAIFVIFNSINFTNLRQVAKLIYAYIFILSGNCSFVIERSPQWSLPAYIHVHECMCMFMTWESVDFQFIAHISRLGKDVS